MGEDMYFKILNILDSLNIDYEEGIITTPKGTHGTVDGTGYLVFKKNGKKFQLHQVLAVYHFGKECIGMTVNHSNGDKLDNSKDNLELLTLSDNVKHQHENGLASYGHGGNPKRKIVAIDTVNDDRIIFNSVSELARELNIKSTSSIYNVLNGKRASVKGFSLSYF